MPNAVLQGMLTNAPCAPIPAPRISEFRPAAHPAEPQLRPLWLTVQEAHLLLALCLVSFADGGVAEGELFVKLGDYMRSFM